MSLKAERGLLPGALFLSGTASAFLALGWAQGFALALGAVPLVRGAVAAVVLGGMALGSFLAVRPVLARFNPVVAFAALAVAAGIAGGLSTLLSGSPSAGALAAAAFGAMVPAAFGAMVPTVIRALEVKNVGALLALASAGAAASPLIAVFLLLPRLGVRRTLVLAAVVLVLVGVGLLAVQRSLGVPNVRTAETLRARAPESLLFAAMVVTGVVFSILEVAWGRILTLVLPATLYLTAVRIAALFLAVALGSALAGALLKRVRAVSVASLAWLFTLAAMISLLSLFVAKALPQFFVDGHRSLPPGETSLFVLPFLVTLLLVFPGAFAFSAVLPSAAAASSRGPLFLRTSYFLSAGLAGGAAGELFAGPLLMSTVGIESAARIATLLLFILAVGLFLRSSRWLGSVVATTLAILVLGLDPTWDAVAKNVGLYSDPSHYARLDRAQLREEMRSYVTLFYKDGATASVTVEEIGRYRLLKENGRTQASNGPEDMEADVLLAHLPLMATPARRVAVLGWGGGVTVGALLAYDVENVVGVEIEPAAVEASSYFERENGKPLGDPRVTAVWDDSRRWLARGHDPLDLILTASGASSFYTVENYRIAASRLAPDGIFAQRLSLRGISEEAFRTSIATIRSVFPHLLLFKGRAALLLCSRVPIRFDLERMKSLFARESVAQSLARVFVRYPADLLVDLRADDRSVDALPPGTRLNTDDNLLLALETPRTMYQDHVEAILRAMPSASLWDHVQGFQDRGGVELELAASYFTKGRKEEALASCESALVARKSFEGLKLKGQILDGLGRTQEARAALESALRLGGDPEGRRFVEALLRALESRTGPSLRI